jgi:lipoprotein-anchoring transpeptidase ErfK/SrfK
MTSGINSQKLFYVISSFFLLVLIIFTLRVNYASSASNDAAAGARAVPAGIIGAAAYEPEAKEAVQTVENVPSDGPAAKASEKSGGGAEAKPAAAEKNEGQAPDSISSIISVEKIKKMPGDFRILIDKSRCELFLYKGEKLAKTYNVSIGRNPDGADKKKKGDLRTPEGNFHIVSIHKSDKWLHEGQLAYGPWFLRLKTPWQGIGIHGTNEPEKLGTKASEGCIRLHSDNIAELKKLVEDQVNSKKKVKVDIVARRDSIE